MTREEQTLSERSRPSSAFPLPNDRRILPPVELGLSRNQLFRYGLVGWLYSTTSPVKEGLASRSTSQERGRSPTSLYKGKVGGSEKT